MRIVGLVWFECFSVFFTFSAVLCPVLITGEKIGSELSQAVRQRSGAAAPGGIGAGVRRRPWTLAGSDTNSLSEQGLALPLVTLLWDMVTTVKSQTVSSGVGPQITTVTIPSRG